MKRKISKFFSETRFKREFRRQIRMMVLITLGFTIAFTWRHTIFDLSLAFVKFITQIQNTSALSIFSSTFITLLSVLLIYLTAHFLKGRKDY